MTLPPPANFRLTFPIQKQNNTKRPPKTPSTTHQKTPPLLRNLGNLYIDLGKFDFLLC